MSFSVHNWFLFRIALLFLVTSEAHAQKQFDYVILGGGTAGLVVASRLSEDPAVSVAVIEAGDFERNNPIVANTTTLGIAIRDPKVDWQYKGISPEYAPNQTLIWSAGKGLGGSSLINGMTYMRPASSQIDLWPSLGLDLDWDEYISFAKKGEHFQPPGPDLVALGAGYEENAHGFNGLLTTCIAPHMTTGDIHEVFNATFKKLGIPPRHEFNGGDLRGFGVQQVTQDGKVDIREDAARAYYYPFEDRTNLVVMVNTTATRILWSDESSYGGVRASAAEVVNQNGDVSTINATREIILSAGALRSPAILEHSGVGNPSILSKFSIKTKVNLPAVGENFQDQSVIAIIGLPLGENPTGFPAFVAHASLEDLFGSETEAFYNSTLARLPEYAATIAAQNGGASSAEAQEHILKTQLDLLFKSNTPTSELVPAALGPILGGVFWFLQPFSRGNVHINSTERTVQPVIDAKFFQLDIDGQVAVATARFIRKFLTTSPTSDRINVTSITPNFETVPEDASDDVWLDWIKTKSNFSPNFHHLGTCAMLPKKYGGVVDNEFRVYGTKNVRVVDLSVIPLQVAGHSTALLYGVAEWAAEKIKKSS